MGAVVVPRADGADGAAGTVADPIFCGVLTEPTTDGLADRFAPPAPGAAAKIERTVCQLASLTLPGAASPGRGVPPWLMSSNKAAKSNVEWLPGSEREQASRALASACRSFVRLLPMIRCTLFMR